METTLKRAATFSDCGKYRYLLYRSWDDSKPWALCIGLNPSTANDDKDDPTIQNVIKVLSHLGFGSLHMANLFALISANPESLRSCPDPVKQNDLYLTYYCRHRPGETIFCWGNFPMAQYRAKRVMPMFPDAKCFGKNKNGTPMHPLALMYNGTVKNPKLIPYAN